MNDAPRLKKATPPTVAVSPPTPSPVEKEPAPVKIAAFLDPFMGELVVLTMRFGVRVEGRIVERRKGSLRLTECVIVGSRYRVRVATAVVHMNDVQMLTSPQTDVSALTETP